MTTPTPANCDTCQSAAVDTSVEETAFVLVLLPDRDGGATEIDYLDLTDPFYDCCDAPSCGCPLVPGSRQWKVQAVLTGGLFDGRVNGLPAVTFEEYKKARRHAWERNITRPLDLQGPRTAYAIVTPDGLWHECVEPEPHDLIFGSRDDVRWTSFVDSQRELSPLQVAWRFAVAEFLMRYQHCWLVGLDAPLTRFATRRCD